MAADYEKHFVDYEVISQLSSVVPWPYPKGGVAEYLKTLILPAQGKERWAWGIFSKQNPQELIGCVDIWRKSSPENRGFWLARKHWGQGIMTEAVEPVMDFAFEKLAFEKLVFTNALGNTRSRRVKEKTGARLIAVAPAKFVNPEYTEHEIWELTKEEWLKRRAVK
jgi:RimJ/RimL family protein N-acetyltransferase